MDNKNIQTFIDQCKYDGQKIEKVIRNFYSSLENRSSFIDGGSNFGYHALFAADCFNDTVFAIEASPKTYIGFINSLKNEHKSLEAEIIPINAALGNRKKQGDVANFFYSSSHPGRSTLNTKMWNEWGKGSVVYEQPISCPIIEIDDLKNFSKTNKKIDFIKLDLEGTEIQALKGGTNTILDDKPSIVIEYGLRPHNESEYDEKIAEFEKFLNEIQYCAYSPWGENFTNKLEVYNFWYLFLFPDDTDLKGKLELLRKSFLSN